MKVRAAYYQQFDADSTLEVPGEGYGGWQASDIELDPAHTAVAVMHAWEWATRETYPGWYRAVEYIPRAQRIYETVFPQLLAAVRASKLTLLHIAGGGDYYKKYPGYAQTLALSAPETPAEQVATDPSLDALRTLRAERVFVGRHNEADVARGFANNDFPAVARPLDHEPIAATGDQLFAVCKAKGINHLIYTGFAIDGCLLMSPGGMVDMSRHGLMCSTIRQAVTAIENKETARCEFGKQMAMWRVGLLFGFVFELDDFLRALAMEGST